MDGSVISTSASSASVRVIKLVPSKEALIVIVLELKLPVKDIVQLHFVLDQKVLLIYV